MRYVCDAPDRTVWFRIETEGEAFLESLSTQGAVAVFFREERQRALTSYRPRAGLSFIERDIGLEAHIQSTMPLFLTLRDHEGAALVTAILPASGKDNGNYPIFVWGAPGIDPYESHAKALEILEKRFELSIVDQSDVCYMYSIA